MLIKYKQTISFFNLTVKNESDAVVIQCDSSTVVTFNTGSACSFLGHLTFKVCIFSLYHISGLTDAQGIYSN